MNNDAIKKLEQDFAEKRAKLERDIALAAKLPTNGRTVTWLGENGWDNEGKPREPVEKTVELLPNIFHGPTAYNTAQHVAYAVPTDFAHTNGRGEHVSSKFRPTFVAKYIRAVLAAYAEHEIDTLVIKSSRYTGRFPDGFDFKVLRDYADGERIASGRCLVTVGAGVGEHSYVSSTLEVFVELPEVGRLKVSFSDVPGAYKLAPRAVGVRRYGGDGPASSVDRWDVPQQPADCAHAGRYGSGDARRLSCTALWLFHTTEAALAALGIEEAVAT